MGLSQSKVIIETLERACRKAENDGEDNIVSVLSEREFINSIRRLWACIPLKTRRSIGRLPDKGPGSSRKMRKAPNMSTITFPQAFTAKLDLWEDNPFLFFKDDSSISLELGRNPLAGSYNYMSRLKQRTETDTMRLRFWKVVYHRLKERLCLNRLRIDNVEIVTRVISRSGMAEDELDLIRRRVSRWTDEGRRIDTLCRDISRAKSLDNAHLGILFCLPDDISDELIRTLPLTGPTREEEIRLLRTRGIVRVEDRERLENLGKTIFDYLWEKMESSISRIHLSELGSNWGLQHTQSFRIQNTRFSYPEYDQGTNALTITCPSGNMNPSSGCPAAISSVPSPRGSESTDSWNSGAIYQASGAPNLQRNADSVQSAFCLHGPGIRTGTDSTFNLFENIEPLQAPQRLAGSQPMTGTQSIFNQYEDGQSLRQPFSGTFDDSLMVGRDSSDIYSQMPNDSSSNQPQNPYYQHFTVPVSVT